VTGDLVSFSTASGEGVKLKAGHVLSSYGSVDQDDAYSFYVTGIATEVITCVNGYDGAAIANSATMPVLLEHQAKPSEYTIQQSIDDIINAYLFPEIFDIIMDSFTPNLSSLQTQADADDEAIVRAWQKVGPTVYQIPIKLIQNMPVENFASGKMLTYDARIGTDINYSAKRRISIANSTNVALEGLIAKGAAALCIEGVEEAPDEDSGSESRPLWQSFFTQKRQFESDIAKESVTQFKIDRG
jgi:hypothetical protein